MPIKTSNNYNEVMLKQIQRDQGVIQGLVKSHSRIWPWKDRMWNIKPEQGQYTKGDDRHGRVPTYHTGFITGAKSYVTMKRVHEHTLERQGNNKVNCYNKLGGFIFLLIAIISISSCKKFVTVDPPSTKLVSESVFDNDSTAIAAMRGIYAHLFSDGFASGGVTSISFLCSLSSDELTNYATPINNQEFYTNAILSTNTTLQSSLWLQPYQYIYAANAVIEGLSDSRSNVSSAIKQQLTGESIFIRAFCHFYLVNLFGDVPLITNTDYNLNTNTVRTPSDSVYKQIVSDLIKSQSLLVDGYAFSGGQKIRANKWAATALLARVYLYKGDYSNALTQSSAIINSDNYKLTSLSQVFLSNNSEAILQILPSRTGINTNDATVYVLNSAPTSSVGGVTLSDLLINAFEPNDNRFTAWVNKYTSGSSSWYYSYKYKVPSGITSVTEYTTLLRLAEQYLIKAEAEAQGNNLVDAISDLNTIRNRAGLPNTTATTQADLLIAILHERQIEFFTEWGHRWLDLKRTENMNTVMSSVTAIKGGTWDNNHALFPIPSVQLLNDPNMKNSQNAGY